MKPRPFLQFAPGAPTVRQGWLATLVLFFVHGLVISAWIARIPGVQSSLGLSNGALGLALLGMAVGSTSAIPVAGTLVNRYGSRAVCTYSAYAFCLALNAPGWAFNTLTLFASLIVFGASAGIMNVSMNAQGVLVEKHLGRPTMSRFHALFSFGAMVGASLGGAVAQARVPIAIHFFAGSLAFLLIAFAACRRLLRASDHAPAYKTLLPPLRHLPAMVWALVGIAVCILLSEGAMADWIAVYLRQTFHASLSTAAGGYAAFSAAMAVSRLAGDHVTLRLGNARTVRYGSLIAASGLACALLAPSSAWAMPGFAATGAGFSVIIPLVFGSAGRVPGVSAGAGIATVTGLGYFGFLVGPPVIGFAAQWLTLRLALILIVILCLTAASLAGFLRKSAPREGAWNEPSPVV